MYLHKKPLLKRTLAMPAVEASGSCGRLLPIFSECSRRRFAWSTLEITRQPARRSFSPEPE